VPRDRGAPGRGRARGHGGGGGDQLRITSQIGDTPVFQRVHALYREGGTVAGTSAGAAAMPQTMLVSGSGGSAAAISGLGMAPGLGLLDGVVVDSHFAERGRMGRLLGAVARTRATWVWASTRTRRSW
jgi:cyanophycinase